MICYDRLYYDKSIFSTLVERWKDDKDINIKDVENGFSGLLIFIKQIPLNLYEPGDSFIISITNDQYKEFNMFLLDNYLYVQHVFTHENRINFCLVCTRYMDYMEESK